MLVLFYLYRVAGAWEGDLCRGCWGGGGGGGFSNYKYYAK